jgi:hypothetical protein
MKKVFILTVLAVMLCAFGTIAGATSLTYGTNQVFYRNYESVFRADVNGDYHELDYSDTNNPPNPLQAGDIFVGIISVQNITNQGNTIWSSNPGIDELSGIFAEQITDIDTASQPGSVIIDLGYASSSSFTTLGGATFDTGLAANEMMRIYTDTGATAFTANQGEVGDVANAVDGALWLSLGDNQDGTANEYAWSLITPFGTALDAFSGESYMGQSVLGGSAAASITGAPLLNDPGEDRYNTDVQFYTNSELEGNDGYTGFPNGYSAWPFQSNDPAFINAVPEPGTIFLLGLGLIGISAFARKRNKA